ncbi:MAG: hypothetical protein ABJ239_07235 [Erythrobacter sp.]
MMSRIKYTIFGLATVALIAGLANWLGGIDFLLAAVIAGAALIVNGFLAEWEDNRPGGFNNPKGSNDE